MNAASRPVRKDRPAAAPVADRRGARGGRRGGERRARSARDTAVGHRGGSAVIQFSIQNQDSDRRAQCCDEIQEQLAEHEAVVVQETRGSAATTG